MSEGAQRPPTPEQSVAQTRGDVAAVARGGLASLIGAAVSAGANFLLVLVVARWGTAHEAGVFFGVTSLFLMLETLLRLGSDVGSVYFFSRWRALGHRERIRPGLAVAYVPVLTCCVVVAGALIVFAPQLAGLLGGGSSGVGLVRLLAVILPVAATYDVALGMTRGLGTMRPTVLIEKIARPVVQVALVVTVLAAGWNGGLGPAWGLPYLLAAAAGYWAVRATVRRVAGGRGTDLRAARGLMRAFWLFALPRAMAAVAQTVLQRLDIVLVAAMRGATEAAIYTAATRFLVVGQFINQAITTPLQPRLSAALARHETGRASTLYRTCTGWIVLISWPIFLTSAVFAPVYLALFGRRYEDGQVVVVILACSMLLASACGPVDNVIIMGGRTSWNLATTLGGLAVNVALDVALIPSLGILGAAIGWCAAIVATNAVPLYLAWHHLGLNPFGPAQLTACLVAALCFGVLPLLGLAISLPVAAVGLGLGAAGYVAVLWRRRDAFELTAFVHARWRLSAAANAG